MQKLVAIHIDMTIKKKLNRVKEESKSWKKTWLVNMVFGIYVIETIFWCMYDENCHLLIFVIETKRRDKFIEEQNNLLPESNET